MVKFLDDDGVWRSASWAAATILKMDRETKLDWPHEEWIKFRDDVRKALAREGIR